MAYTPISSINGETQRVNVQGMVMYTSGIENWRNNEGSGRKLSFDIADESGEIRVFAWDAAADAIGGTVSRQQFLQLGNVSVNHRTPQFNNLMRHPFELKFELGFSGINIREGHTIPVTQEEVTFVPYDEVRSSRYPEFTYFSVTGRVVDIDPLWDGTGDRGNPFTKQVITIEDERGSRLKVASWNEYIPVSSDTIGRTLTVIRGKYIGGTYDELNSSGARIEIDGERVL